MSTITAYADADITAQAIIQEKYIRQTKTHLSQNMCGTDAFRQEKKTKIRKNETEGRGNCNTGSHDYPLARKKKEGTNEVRRKKKRKENQKGS